MGIAEARKNMQMMLSDAADSAQQDVQKAEAVEIKKQAEEAKPSKDKKFTWAQLQAGADSKPDTRPKVNHLLKSLKSAPRTHKAAKVPSEVEEHKTKKSALSALTSDFEDDAEEEMDEEDY